jgi:ElaB/YqjD/DUF883 family membrane-anchored ribosome-binding protein
MSMLTSSAAGLADSARHMADEAEEFLKVAAQSGDARFDAFRERFSDRVRQVRARVDDWESEAVHQVRRAARTADRSVHTHPYRAMGIAAAAGVLIGLLASRR